MGLNLSKGDMYKFVNYTWNPIKGKCLHDCSYCYMKQINPNANPPRLAEYELNTDLGCGRSIFYWQFHGYVRRRHTIRMDCQSVGLLLSEQKHVTAQRLPVAVQEPQEIFGVHQPSDYGTCGILHDH